MTPALLFSSPTIVVFDTEYTAWEGSREAKWKRPGEYREIVQIGAVLLDTRVYSEKASFDVFIKPKRNPELSDYFSRLTGITQHTIDHEGVDFSDAITRFFSWAGTHDLYSFGSDAEVLEENCRLCEIPFPFDRMRFKDIRALFDARGIPAYSYTSGTIVTAFGEALVRPPHNALNDSRTIVDGLRLLAKINE